MSSFLRPWLAMCCTASLAVIAFVASDVAAQATPASHTQAGHPPAGFDVRTSDIPATFLNAPAGADYVREEAMIPMRDGVKLFTVIWRPKHSDAATPDAGMPIVLTRTPYDAASRPAYTHRPNSPRVAAAVPLPDAPLLQNGYIRVYQDVRGKYGSEGNYTMNLPLRGPLNDGPVDQATDAWDTIDWLVKNVPDNNGKVGIIGVSYEGWTALMALFDAHPALKAAIPMNPMVDGWIGDDWYHNGAFRQFSLEYVYRQTTVKGASEPPTGGRDTYAAYLATGSANDMARKLGVDRFPAWLRSIDNPAYTDFWKAQAVDRLLAARPTRVPVLTVHGTWDQEDIYGPIAAYTAMEKTDTRNDRNYLLIGPWFHGQQDPWFHTVGGASIGALPLGRDTTQDFLFDAMLPFFDQHLKGRKPATPIPPVRTFLTGDNQWRSYQSWPPRAAATKRLYLRPGGTLSFAAGTGAGEGGYDEYISDPAKPVPYRVQPIIPQASQDSTWGIWLVDDQRPFASRPDVLTYVSEPLTEAMTLTGDVVAQLQASTTGTDADWVVKLIDAWPDEEPLHPQLGGYQLMVSADILRGRYREDFSVARPITPDATLPYRIRMPHASHTFLPGHRIMVQVQSSWFPLYDRNPQTFVDNIARAVPGDYRKATQRIHAGSHIELTVLPPP